MPDATGREKMDELKRMAERICVLILDTDYPEIDVLIERAKVREKCEELFPDRLDLYDMIYESRFDRLWEQFRVQPAL
jgi:hypothetical protein